MRIANALGEKLREQGKSQAHWISLLGDASIHPDLRAEIWSGAASSAQANENWLGVAVEALDEAPPCLAFAILRSMAGWLADDASGRLHQCIYDRDLPSVRESAPALPCARGSSCAILAMIDLWFAGDDRIRERILPWVRQELESKDQMLMLNWAAGDVLYGIDGWPNEPLFDRLGAKSVPLLMLLLRDLPIRSDGRTDLATETREIIDEIKERSGK